MISEILLAAIFLLLGLAGALFILIVFPVWMLTDCIRAKSFTNVMKMLWLVTIVIAWPFGSLAYGSFASQKKSLMRLANIMMVILIILSLLCSAGIYYFRTVLLPEAVSRYQKVDFKGISKQDQDRIRTDLGILQNEMQANSFFSAKSLVALQLFELFQSIAIHQAPLPSELLDWIQQVKNHEKSSEKNLSDTMNSLRDKTIRNILNGTSTPSRHSG